MFNQVNIASLEYVTEGFNYLFPDYERALFPSVQPMTDLWWLREDTLMMELEPYFEVGNRSFRTLAKLTGRRYVGVHIRGSSGGVTVNVGDVINQIKSHTNIT